MKVEQKQRRTFTLSTQVLGWIDSKAKESKVNRSELVNQLLDSYYQEERKKEMEEGYKALRDILQESGLVFFSLQKKVVPDYSGKSN